MDTVDRIFEDHVRGLSVVDRLQLVRLIMDDLADSAPQWVIDAQDEWKDDDLYDLSRASLHYADHVLGDQDEPVESR